MKNSKKREGAAAITAAPGAGGETGVVQGTASSLLARRTEVNRKMRGSISVGGLDIHISGAGIFKYLCDPCPDHEGKVIETACADTEFSLKLSEGKGEPKAVEFSSWINLADADIKIGTNASLDGEFHGWFEVYFEDKDGKKLELVFSTEQARILAGVFSDFVQARDSWARLKGSWAGQRNLDRD